MLLGSIIPIRLRRRRANSVLLIFILFSGWKESPVQRDRRLPQRPAAGSVELAPAGVRSVSAAVHIDIQHRKANVLDDLDIAVF